MSLPKQFVWFRLRDPRLAAFHFYQNYNFGPYSLDFYSPHLRLAIEIKQTAAQGLDITPIEERDGLAKKRKHFFARRGISVLSLNNEQVYYRLDGILNLLTRRLKKYVSQARYRPQIRLPKHARIGHNSVTVSPYDYGDKKRYLARAPA